VFSFIQKSSQIQALVDRRNLLLLRETTNLEACFWSRFPTYEYLRVREGLILQLS
jgi:type IV secretory pathway VirB4 component